MTALDYRSAAVPSDQQSHPSRGHWLLWAIYLAMSWTWCIGMFLPVLLVRDYGVWGWVVFAIPNVLGAAAVGWINRTAEQSRETLRAHRYAILAFSVVTVVFQVFFAVWALDHFTRYSVWLIAGMILGAVPVAVVGARRPLAVPWMALAVLAISLVCITAMARHGDLMPLSSLEFKLREAPPHALAFLAAPMCLGFLLCPHLDQTFHRARQRMSGSGSRLAFSFGFLGPFLGMIVFSLFYAPLLILALRSINFAIYMPLTWLCVHFAVQLAFTIGVHWQGGPAGDDAAFPQRWSLIVASVTLAAGVVCWLVVYLKSSYQLDSGEMVYRLFMSFYGLVFPAYVWLCMIPGRWVNLPTRRQWVVCGVAILVAAPMFWLAFIDGRMVWAVPGVAIVLVSRLAVGGTARATSP